MQSTLTRPTPKASGAPQTQSASTDMNAAAYPPVTVVPAGGGTMLNAFGDGMQVKLDPSRTGSPVEIFLGTVPPGGGPPPHIHRNEDEIFLVIEGRIRYMDNGQWSEPLGPGALVYAPRGSRHAFQNVDETPSRHCIITTGSGFGQFFSRCADVFAGPMPPDMGRIIEISTDHGIEYVPALAPPPSEAASA